MPLFLIPFLSGLKAFFGTIIKALLDWRVLAAWPTPADPPTQDPDEMVKP